MGVQLRALAGEHGSFWRARQQVRHVDSLCAFCSYERGGSKTERGGMCCCWSPPKRAELLRTDACAVCAPPPLPSLPLLRRGVGLQRMCMQPSKRQRRFYLHLRANHQCVPAITLSARPPTAILDSSSPLFCILPLSSFLLVPSRPAPTGQREVARHHPPLATGRGMPEQKHIAWHDAACCSTTFLVALECCPAAHVSISAVRGLCLYRLARHLSPHNTRPQPSLSLCSPDSFSLTHISHHGAEGPATWSLWSPPIPLSSAHLLFTGRPALARTSLAWGMGHPARHDLRASGDLAWPLSLSLQKRHGRGIVSSASSVQRALPPWRPRASARCHRSMAANTSSPHQQAFEPEV